MPLSAEGFQKDATNFVPLSRQKRPLGWFTKETPGRLCEQVAISAASARAGINLPWAQGESSGSGSVQRQLEGSEAAGRLMGLTLTSGVVWQMAAFKVTRQQL